MGTSLNFQSNFSGKYLLW